MGHRRGHRRRREKQNLLPYYRPELAWKIDSAGHGLGLAVARCAKLMKVKYGMHSVEGKGSRFWMRFTQYIGEDKAPETAAAYDNTATPIRYARAAPAGGGRRSLVTSGRA